MSKDETFFQGGATWNKRVGSVRNISEFSKELRALINKHSIEDCGDIPDYIIADYLVRCLFAAGVLCQERDAHSASPATDGSPGPKQKFGIR